MRPEYTLGAFVIFILWFYKAPLLIGFVPFAPCIMLKGLFKVIRSFKASWKTFKTNKPPIKAACLF